MTRAIIELLIIVIFVIGARSILNTVFRGLKQAANSPHQRVHANAPSVPAGGELHKDPICGTYVAGSTQFQRQFGSETYYYCSAGCRERHRIATAKVG